MMQKVKDVALAGHVTDAEQSWWRVLLPVSTRLG
jgi:hypothetical protein